MRKRFRCSLVFFLLGVALVAAGSTPAESPFDTLRDHQASDPDGEPVALSFQSVPEHATRKGADQPTPARIVVTNARSGGNRDRDGYGNWLARQKPDLSIVSEASRMAPHLRPAGRTFNAGDASLGRREVAIVVRDGLRVLGHDCGAVSPDLHTGIAPDRWWTRVETHVAGVKSRVYSLHLNAVIQQPDGHPRNTNRWTVTRKGLARLEHQWQEDIDDGWAVIVGGDFNWNHAREHARSHDQSPGRIFQRLKMSFVNVELLWLAWTPQTHSLAGRRVIPVLSIPGLFAGEHPALVIDLGARRHAGPIDPGKDGDDGHRAKEGNEERGDTEGKEADGAKKNGIREDQPRQSESRTAGELFQILLKRLQQVIRLLTRLVLA
ncbi:MAG: hypothetical protein GX442_08780 [Candidatus Riflebacteria bacterium]|nr:hypothetical protein [Candidatus Riflebacteria bacterium]